MDRLYTALAGLLILGGVAALIGQAWPLGILLLVLGFATLAVELRQRRTAARVVLDGGPDAGLEAAKGQSLQGVQAQNIRQTGWTG